MITIGDIYKITKEQSIPMLSDFTNPTSDFWAEYKTNFAQYDRFFYISYKSFFPFEQDFPRSIFYEPSPEYIAEVQKNFTSDVKTFLMLNSKNYSELFRTYNLLPEDYSLTENYSMTESLEKNGNGTETVKDGARTDSNDLTYGERSDITSISLGEQTTTTTLKVSPYDSTSFNEDTQATETLGGKTDDNTLVKGAQTDKTEFAKGEQVNEKTTNNKEDYSLTSSGNDGKMTKTQVLEEHDNFWKLYEFYSYIFSEIARSLLLVD